NKRLEPGIAADPGLDQADGRELGVQVGPNGGNPFRGIAVYRCAALLRHVEELNPPADFLCRLHRDLAQADPSAAVVGDYELDGLEPGRAGGNAGHAICSFGEKGRPPRALLTTPATAQPKDPLEEGSYPTYSRDVKSTPPGLRSRRVGRNDVRPAPS